MKWEALLDKIRGKIHPPLAVMLGSPHEVAELLKGLGASDVTCYQMDLYQAGRLREEITEHVVDANVVTAADPWDLPADFQTVLYPTSESGERDLKIDMVDQAFHILRPHGSLVVLSPYDKDQLFPTLLKKVFRRVHATVAEGTVFWCSRDGQRPRRRHEVTFHARIGEGPSLRFLSRPGVFTYGRFDDGARALVETMRIDKGDRILDIGCGCGSCGIAAARQAGPEGHVAFVDSNLRAIALAEHNARLNAIESFQAIATADLLGLPESSFDVALANPPYFAQGTIAQHFIERARALLRPEGRLYLVTKQPDQVGPVMAEYFGKTEVVQRRGYVVLCSGAL